MRLQMRLGDSGNSLMLIPNGLRASSTALARSGGMRMVVPSPLPFDPMTEKGEGCYV